MINKRSKIGSISIGPIISPRSFNPGPSFVYPSIKDPIPPLNPLVAAARAAGALLVLVADLGIINSGGNMETWEDQSTNNYHATVRSEGINYPVEVTGPNGKNAISNYGGVGATSCGFTTLLGPLLEDFSVYVVYKEPVGAINGGGARIVDKHYALGFWFGANNPAFPRSVLGNIRYPASPGAANTIDGEWNLSRFGRKGTVGTISASTNISTGSVPSTVTSSDRIGICTESTITGAATDFSGYIACVILVPSFVADPASLSGDGLLDAINSYYAL